MDIKQALKEEIKSLQAQLKRAEKSLEAYTAESGAPKGKPAPRTTAAGTPSATTTSASGAATSPGNLPERIAAYLGTNGLKSVEELVAALNAPKNQVATTCSRMVRKGLLEKHEQQGKPTLYSEMIAPANPGVEAPNPFAGGTN